MKSLIVFISRFINSLSRSSRRANHRLMRERKEDIDSSFIFRDAITEDIPALARLHVLTWNDTYPGVRNPPTYELRERQWRDLFGRHDGSWFIILVEKKQGGLVGFARGVKLDNDKGDLNKIYLLREYQRLGLGSRLICKVAQRFLDNNIQRMHVIAEANNPSCWFYEKMGARKMHNDNGSLNHGNYEWYNLKQLVSICSHMIRRLS
jgi:GNAT superfamily N-acetyltransferase